MHGEAEVFGPLTSAVGTVAGGLVVANIGITCLAPLTVAARVFGLAML